MISLKLQHAPLIAAFLLVFACGEGQAPDGTKPAANTNTNSAAQVAQAPAPTAGLPAKPMWMAESDDGVPTEPFTKGQAAFNEVRDSLLKSYYADGISEDDIYRAATAGMLEKLEPRMKKYNKLMSPREVAEMKSDLKGEIVGVGVKIEFDSKSGYTDVLGVIPGSASEKAGLLAGDKIVTVNGKLYKGLTLRDVAYDIRGKEGTSVQMSILRGDKLLPFTLTRTKLNYDQPAVTLYPDGLGYVRIPSFTEKTTPTIKAGLEDLAKQNPKALVIDLRHAPGGLFEAAVSTAELLLPAGSPIAILKKKGTAEETHVSHGQPILGDLPAVVLVDEQTASGAELLATALHESRHAKLVGAKTYGKWSVQQLDDLDNGYAFKYTLGLFKTPSGKTYEGVGVQPDVDVAMDETALSRSNDSKPEDRLNVDVQLRTAKQLVLPTAATTPAQ